MSSSSVVEEDEVDFFLTGLDLILPPPPTEHGDSGKVMLLVLIDAGEKTPASKSELLPDLSTFTVIGCIPNIAAGGSVLTISLREEAGRGSTICLRPGGPFKLLTSEAAATTARATGRSPARFMVPMSTWRPFKLDFQKKY